MTTAGGAAGPPWVAFASMSTKPGKPDWQRLERASRLAAREDYQRSTPGGRVEEQIEISRELTKLALRRARTR